MLTTLHCSKVGENPVAHLQFSFHHSLVRRVTCERADYRSSLTLRTQGWHHRASPHRTTETGKAVWRQECETRGSCVYSQRPESHRPPVSGLYVEGPPSWSPTLPLPPSHSLWQICQPDEARNTTFFNLKLCTFNDAEIIMTTYFSLFGAKGYKFQQREQRINEKLLTHVQWK